MCFLPIIICVSPEKFKNGDDNLQRRITPTYACLHSLQIESRCEIFCFIMEKVCCEMVIHKTIHFYFFSILSHDLSMMRLQSSYFMAQVEHTHLDKAIVV